METLLLIAVVIVAGMAYVTFREYLYNPSSRPNVGVQTPTDDVEFNDPYKNIPSSPILDREEKIRNGESGIIIGLLGKIASVDGGVCELEREIVANLMEDIANHLQAQMATLPKEQIKAILDGIFKEARESNTGYASVEKLATDFANISKGEYKRRLKLVEFLFIVAYADGRLATEEREVILDVAAYLEISNEDFNEIYDAFESYFSKPLESIGLSRAYEILEIDKDASVELAHKAYKDLIFNNRLNLFDHKSLEVDVLKKYMLKLQEADLAYRAIIESKKEKESNVL